MKTIILQPKRLTVVLMWSKIGKHIGLPIKHVGFAVYTTPCIAHKFSLHNMSHVPWISKNLLSLAKFSRNNNVFLEFHSDFCLIKHQETKEIFR